MKEFLSKTMALRSRLYEKREWFYLPFVLGMGGAMSFGLNSTDRVYLILFAMTTLLLGIKLIITDYSWREMLAIGVVGALLLLNFLTNGEKTLIVTFLAIIGAKGIDLDRVFRYSLWSKAALTILRVTFAVTGVMENNSGDVGKFYGVEHLYFYGFNTANTLSMDIVIILLMAFLVYRDKIKWYLYLAAGVLVAASFPFLKCKTGLIVWAVFCLLNVAGWLSAKLRAEGIYLRLCAAIPCACCALTYGLVVWYHYHNESDALLSKLFTGRIQMIENSLYRGGQSGLLLGVIPREPFDNGYYHIPHNYGWLMLALWLAVYTLVMWRRAAQREIQTVMVLAAMSVYIFMEFAAISIFWTTPLLYMAWALYPEDAPCGTGILQRNQEISQ